MSSVGAGGSYISDGQIMAWLAEQQNRLYGDLRESMDLSQERAGFADEMNDIKAELQAANKSHDFTKVDQHIQEVLGRYEGTEGFDELCEGLRGMADTIRSDVALRENYAASLEQYQQDKQRYEDAGGSMLLGFVVTEDDNGLFQVINKPIQPNDPGPMGYDDKTMDAWTNQIGDKLDIVNKNDQLTMIRIQELKANIDQSSQLGSSFISSGDKTSSAIINNIA